MNRWAILGRPYGTNPARDRSAHQRALTETVVSLSSLRPGMRLRAGYWYSQAQPNVTERLDKERIEKRLEAIGERSRMALRKSLAAASRGRADGADAARKPEPAPAKAQQDAPVAAFVAPNKSDHMTPTNTGDGKFTNEEVNGIPVLAGQRYLYFRIDDEILKDLSGDKPVLDRVTMLDTNRQRLDIEYDGHVDDPKIKSDGRYLESLHYQMIGSGRLQQVNFLLHRPRLANRQNYGSDFRIRGSELLVHQVQVFAVPSQ